MILMHFLEKQTAPDSNPLQWWKSNAHKFPVNRLVKRYLRVPAISVPEERIFSVAALTINSHRASLKPENIDILIFFNKNLK